MEKCEELLPDYFGFIKGLVDSQDLSLNISREMLQHDRHLKIIAKNIENKIKSELEKMLKDNRDEYEKFFKAFGVQLKYGTYDEYGANKDKLKETEISNKEKIEKSLKLLSEHYPEFSSCQMETMSAINYALLCVNLNYDKCVIKRVYNKDDSTKTPVIYVYADIPDEGKCFFVAEKGWTEFSNISEEEFIAKYECYNNDLKLTNGHRPWETKIEELNQKEQKGNRNMEEI